MKLPPDKKAGGTLVAAGTESNCAHSLTSATPSFKPATWPMIRSRSKHSRHTISRWSLEILEVVEELRRIRGTRRARR